MDCAGQAAVLRLGVGMHNFRVFISTAEQAHGLPITTLVDKTIQEYANISKDDIYFYRRDGNTNRIDAKILDSIDKSAYLLLVIDDDYFSSTYCFREFFRFYKYNSRSLDDILVVISQGLLAYNRMVVNKLSFSEHVKLDQIALGELSQEEASFLEAEWVPALEELIKKSKYIDFSGGVPTDEVKNQLRKGLEDPKSVHIARCARMAAFCLGADRFHDGGWGYSLGDYAEIDSGDGDRLPSGPYGMAIIGLRAIGQFLRPEELGKEIAAVFRLAAADKIDADFSSPTGLEAVYERNPLKVVHDNLPDVSNYISHLDVGIISHNSGHANRAISESHKQFRWVLQNEEKGKLEFRSIAFASLAKSIYLSEDKKKWIASNLLTYSYLNTTNGNHEPRRDDNNLLNADVRKFFATALKNAMDSHHSIPEPDFDRLREYTLAKLVSAEAISSLSAGPGVALSSDEKAVQRFIEIRAHASVREDDEIDELVAQARAGCASARVRLSCFLADCAAALRLKPTDVTVRGQFLTPVANHIFAHPNAETIVSQLDAIGWAAVIDIAFSIHWHDISSDQRQTISEDLAGRWESGKALKRLHAKLIEDSREGKANYAGVSLEIPEAYRLVLKDYLGDLAENWPSGEPGEDAIETRKTALRGMISNASFQIGRAATKPRSINPRATPLGSETRPICGSLRVCADSGRVEIETPGYHKLFLEPFRDLTGMDVVNLSTISREFGDRDKTLVDIMGKMVVAETYASGADGTLRMLDFIERTQEITDMLKAQDIDDGYGMEDLIKLRAGKDGTRWVHRTAILQRPRAGKRTIAWRFAQVPNQIAEMCVREGMPEERSAGTAPLGGASI